MSVSDPVPNSGAIDPRRSHHSGRGS